MTTLLCEQEQPLRRPWGYVLPDVRDAETSKKSANNLPPVLPHQLSRLDMREFPKLLDRHRDCMLVRFAVEDIEKLGAYLAKLHRASRVKRVFINALEDYKQRRLGFSDCWRSTSNRFLMLQAFYGGLASAFPNTSIVDSDFSVIGVKKNDYRKSLTDFSLEVVLH
eukprot:IDg1791t1